MFQKEGGTQRGGEFPQKKGRGGPTLEELLLYSNFYDEVTNLKVCGLTKYKIDISWEQGINYSLNNKIHWLYIKDCHVANNSYFADVILKMRQKEHQQEVCIQENDMKTLSRVKDLCQGFQRLQWGWYVCRILRNPRSTLFNRLYRNDRLNWP